MGQPCAHAGATWIEQTVSAETGSMLDQSRQNAITPIVFRYVRSLRLCKVSSRESCALNVFDCLRFCSYLCHKLSNSRPLRLQRQRIGLAPRFLSAARTRTRQAISSQDELLMCVKVLRSCLGFILSDMSSLKK